MGSTFDVVAVATGARFRFAADSADDAVRQAAALSGSAWFDVTDVATGLRCRSHRAWRGPVAPAWHRSHWCDCCADLLAGASR